MLAAVQRRLRLLALRKDQPGLGGFTWPFVVSIDIALVIVAVIAAIFGFTGIAAADWLEILQGNNAMNIFAATGTCVLLGTRS